MKERRPPASTAQVAFCVAKRAETWYDSPETGHSATEPRSTQSKNEGVTQSCPAANARVIDLLSRGGSPDPPLESQCSLCLSGESGSSFSGVNHEKHDQRSSSVLFSAHNLQRAELTTGHFRQDADEHGQTRMFFFYRPIVPIVRGHPRLSASHSVTCQRSVRYRGAERESAVLPSSSLSIPILPQRQLSRRRR